MRLTVKLSEPGKFFLKFGVKSDGKAIMQLNLVSFFYEKML